MQMDGCVLESDALAYVQVCISLLAKPSACSRTELVDCT